MAAKPRSALPVVMALAVATGLTRMVLQKVKDDREAQKAQDKDAGTPQEG